MRESCKPSWPWDLLGRAAQLLPLAALILALSGSANAQGEAAPKGSQEAAPAPRDLPALIERLTAEIDATRARLEQARSEGNLAEDLFKPVELLERKRSLLNQLQSLGEAKQATLLEVTEAQAQLDQQRSLSVLQPAPYSFLVLESLRDQVRDEALRAERAASATKAAREALAKSQVELDTKERARRQIKEQFDTAKATDTGQLASALRLAELESQVARETLAMHEADAAAQDAAVTLSKTRLTALEERLAFVVERAQLTEEDRSSVALDLARREERLKQATDAAQRSLDYLSSLWLDSRRKQDQALVDNAAIVEEVETLKQGQAYRRAELTMLSERLQRISSMRTLWERRFAIFDSEGQHENSKLWAGESREALQKLDIATSLTTGHLAEVRNDLVTLQEQSSADLAPEILRWLSQRKSYFHAKAKVFEENLASIELLRRLHLKLLDDIGLNEGRFNLISAGSDAWDGVLSVWSYELTSVEDRPITVGKLVQGLFLLFFGVYLSKALSRFLGRRLLPRLGLAEGGLQAFQSLCFYLLVVTFALIALRIVNVPLTAFTILGGALAIGFGFGSQNLVNNFISGLILLAERPIRASDLIQLGELYGTVEHIGLRSTRIRTGENVEIIVPNSTFLQENVINWTLTDTDVRVKVGVGVMYGSPTRDVKELLRKAVATHGKVLKSPDPVVLFTNFGDNSLDFEVHFWVRMRSLMEQRMVQSDIRFMIDSLCREAGIVIAFPQRDVHLDTVKPLEVRIVKDADAGSQVGG